MAASHVLRIEEANEVRTAMSLVDFDGAPAMAEGDTIGLTVGTTDKDGGDVHVASAVLHTVPAGGQSAHDAVAALVALISGTAGVTGIAGCDASFAENAADEFVLHVRAQASAPFPAVAAVIATPVLVIA